ncbi:DUF192 domain-containing protein [Candidatus Gottesmanbacteria bacterium]|nr:DUF192 domain-containing protein [Candidatus Gottesmanbacteria bacterium]
MTRFLVLLILSFAAISLYFIKLQRTSKLLSSTIKINEQEIKVKLARTSREIEKGLGGQDQLTEKEGMLFIMPGYDRYSFWMKGMKFPLDIIWIEKDTVVDITKNIPLENNGNLTIYQPKTPANLVLEVNAGFSDKFGIKVGDKLFYSL